MIKLLLSLAIFALLSSAALAQSAKVTVEPVFFSAAPMVIELPLPSWDSKSDMGGVISVGVKVDETGAITVTDDGEGPYPICKNVTNPRVLALRSAAVAAARLAKFSPAIIDSRPTAVSGRINYSFGVTGEKTGGLAGLSSSEMRLDRVTKLGTTDGSMVARVDPSEKPGTARIIYPDGQKPATVAGGVLNGKASSLAKPSYPAAAKAVRAGGAVSVQVLIVEDGTVYTASAVSGHPLLRRSSEIAACSSSFAPTLLEGTPVKVSGVITYNYVP